MYFKQLKVAVHYKKISLNYRLEKRKAEKLAKKKKEKQDAAVAARKKRAATARPERIWDYGVIPYEIEANFSGKVHFLYPWTLLLKT